MSSKNIEAKRLTPAYKERLYQILLNPHITEKATKIADSNNQIVFRALQNSKKSEIKDAVEMIFKVKVIRVQTLWGKPKLKRRGMYEGVRSGYKKAIVSVKKGQEVNFAAEQAKEKVS